MKLSDIWQALVCASTNAKAGLPGSVLDQAITKTVIDSRAAEPGALFVAFRGEKTDGHIYLQQAFEKGAVAAIAEPHALGLGLHATFVTEDGALTQPLPPAAENRPLVFIVPDSLVGLQKLASAWRAQMPAKGIGITGSVGKTTTKETVANVLAQRFTTLRNEGNLNNEIGLPLTLLELTPSHQRLVLEMGMYGPGEIAQLCRLAQPKIGIVTNIGPTHLERLGSMARIAQAKAELIRALPDADEGGSAILNIDDPLVREMAGLTAARVFQYGLDRDADLWADEISSEGLDGIRCRLHYGKDSFHLRLPMLGRHSVHTALRGAAVGLVEGMSWTDIIAGLQEVHGQLRIIVAPGLHGATIIDDTYNASPASMLAALNLLEDIANGESRPIAVLGEMLELGPYEAEGHRVVGGRAAQVVAKLITVGSRAQTIAEAAIRSGKPVADVHPVADNDEAIATLKRLIRSGDVVLVKGSRGAGMERIVDALSLPRPLPRPQPQPHRTEG